MDDGLHQALWWSGPHWVDSKNGEPVNDKDVKEKEILAHTGVRLIGQFTSCNHNKSAKFLFNSKILSWTIVAIESILLYLISSSLDIQFNNILLILLILSLKTLLKAFYQKNLI